MSRTVQVVIDCADPYAVGQFWAQALGYVQEPPPEGFDSWDAALDAYGVAPEDRNSAYAVVDPDGAGPRVFFQRVPESKEVKNRVHLDIRVGTRGTPVPELEAAILAEVERLEALGARKVDWREEFGKHFMVMQDVEGNEFCLT